MAKVLGTGIVVWANGEVIALQKDLSIEIDRELNDSSNKQSGQWKEHELGDKSVQIPFDALVSTDGLSATDLYALIISGTQSILLVIEGFTYPMVAEVDLKQSSIKAPHGGLAGLSGTFVAKGEVFQLSPTVGNLITDADGSDDYDTFTPSGIAIASAINSAGSAYANLDAFGVTSGDVLKLLVFVTLTSGELPTVGIWDNSSAYVSNTEQLVAGFNLVTLTATGTDASCSFRITNSAAASWSMSNLYLIKT